MPSLPRGAGLAGDELCAKLLEIGRVHPAISVLNINVTRNVGQDRVTPRPTCGMAPLNITKRFGLG